MHVEPPSPESARPPPRDDRTQHEMLGRAAHLYDGDDTTAGHDEEDDHPHSSSAPPLVEVADHGRSIRRRSSMSIAPPVVSETAATATPSTIVAGDQVARPHFLKEQSMAMRASLSLASVAPASSTNSQSRASSFLVGLVEKSRTSASSSSLYDTKPAPQSNQTMASNVRSPSQPRESRSPEPNEPVPRRRPSILIGVSHVAKLGHLKQQKTMPTLLREQRPPLQSIQSGLSQLAAHCEEDAHEYVAESELLDKSLQQLVRDLTLYKKKRSTLVRILNEIHRRLQDAEVWSSDTHEASHVAMCQEIVEHGVLATVVLLMREFRFHVVLQTAAVTLLSFLADVSDLYAYMLFELDAEPLIQKVVGAHVSQERLVMTGSSLAHAIAESKHKLHVIKLHKARQIEKEKKRAASFVEAFAAERKLSKANGALGGGGLSSSTRALDDRSALGDVRRPASRPQTRMLSAELGTPPVLTAHYQLETPGIKRRPSAIPPLGESRSGSRESESEASMKLDDKEWMRPITSPELRAHSRECPSSRLRASLLSPSATKVAAVYSRSLVFVAPSPLGMRMNSMRKTQSATALKRKTTIPRGSETMRAGTNGSGGLGDARTVDDAQDEEQELPQGNETGATSTTPRVNESSRPSDNDQRETDHATENRSKEADEDEDPAYDDDFAPEDDEENEASRGTGRLLPVGSDSELFELLDSSRNVRPQEEDSVLSGRLLPTESDGELVAMIDTNAVGDSPVASHSSRQTEDPVTSELVSLLSACVDRHDPTAATPTESYQGNSPKSKREKKRAAKLRRPTPSPLVASWSPPSTIVRPVSRRIMDKTVTTTKKISPRHVPTSSRSSTRRVPTRELFAVSPARATAQLTTILEKIDADPEGRDRHEAAIAAASDSSAVAFSMGRLHSPPETSTPTTSVAQIQALYARGLQHHKANELDAAVRCYEEGIQLQHRSGGQREFASLYINLGSARLAQQRLNDALTAFAHAERIQPLNAKAAFNSGLVLMQTDQWEAAAAKFQSVLAVDHTHLRAQHALAQCRHAVQSITGGTK